MGEFEPCWSRGALSTRFPGAGCFVGSPPRAFTLVEILIVFAIIATLANIGVPIWVRIVAESKEQAAVQELKTVQQEIQIFVTRHGRLPDSLEEAGLGDLRDPWGNPFQYIRIAGAKGKKVKCRKDHSLHPINSDFDLYSMGPDGRSSLPLTAKASRDDIIRANDGTYFGVAANY